MDLASVVAALASVGVRVSGSTPNSSVQVDSSRACPTGLAGPEPSGTINDPGQHFHGSRGYLNVVPLVSQPQPTPQYGPVDPAASGEVTITLPWCCANEALRGMPCASPSCPRRAQISSCGNPDYHNPSRNWPSSSWNPPAYGDGNAPVDLTELARTNIPYQCPTFETTDADIDDIEMGGPGEVPSYNRPASWAQWGDHLSPEVTRNLEALEALCLLATSKLIGQERIASDFLMEYFFLLQDEINTRMWWRSQEDDSFAIFLQIWKASPFPKEKGTAPVAGPSAPHPPVSIRDDLAAAVEEGILEAARQASLEIRAEGAPQVDSWLRTTEISGPTACSGPSGHGMYCPADCSCRFQRDAELQTLKDQMQLIIRFGPREAGDGEMRQGATGRRQGGGRKTTGWRQEDDRPAAGERQGSDRKRQAGDRKATGEVRQEGDRRATGRRQGGDRETTGKRQETRHGDRISDRKATGRRQEGNRASGDREATGKRQEKATGERQESDRRAAGCFFATGRRQEGDRKATGVRQESDMLVEDNTWDKIVHGFLYRWIYVKKMRTNVLHLFILMKMSFHC